jgi:hypothetical protein
MAPDPALTTSKLFKELSELRRVRNFQRVVLPISSAFFIYTFGCVGFTVLLPVAMTPSRLNCKLRIWA